MGIKPIMDKYSINFIDYYNFLNALIGANENDEEEE